MSIEEINPHHGLDVFNVSQTIQVFDRQTADALNHLFDHLDLLWTAGLGLPDEVSAKVISKWKHYGVTPTEFVEGFDERTLLETVQKECHILLDYVARIIAVRYQEGYNRSIREQAEQAQIELLAEMQTRVPFLDYSAQSRAK